MAELGQTTFANSDEIDVRELIRVLWAGKWIISIVAAAFAVLAVFVSLMLPNIYRSEALLAPNDQDGAGGLSALAKQYGGLASFAGIDLSGGSSDKTALSLEVLRSRKFITEFIERHDVRIPLMAAKRWSLATGELEIDPDIYDVSSGQWVREVKPPMLAEPSLQEAYREFMKIMTVDQDTVSGFTTVAIEFYSPVLAKKWVDLLVEDLNTSAMHRDVSEAEQAIEYLNQQISNTSLSGLQGVFFNLIEEQTKTVILARVSDEYMFRTLDPAIEPDLKVKPRRSLIVLAAIFVGGLFGMLAVFIRKGKTLSKKAAQSPMHE